MDAELLKTLAGVPVELIMIFIIVQQQKQINLLLERIVQSEREYAANLCALFRDFSGMDHRKNGNSEN